jgi:hypothetical protein
MNEANVAAAESHVRRIVGPTILMGDGSYFDFEDPASSQMTIDDYAWALAGTNRFRGQTRERGYFHRRCLYNVAQHCIVLAQHMLDDGHDRADALAGLMHEAGEVPWGDTPGPAKPLVPDLKAREKRDDAIIRGLFGAQMRDPDLIKQYDLRMLATEKRDLMPHGAGEGWEWIRGFEPFPETIRPWRPEWAAAEFVRMYRHLTG